MCDQMALPGIRRRAAAGRTCVASERGYALAGELAPVAHQRRLECLEWARERPG
ncbi:MAG: hypothetical protein AW11_02149 [Candidatus Accumulibacter regalis]|uniref:Uncharacterized protein n=1 Tax=Accumulibacter regalis TaxID=522306 RepID=A0A011RBG3_ACCRE|nr:MAG: hypothetical protein AW11_02149 [Candidatus Accumulibacter regalis]